MPRTLVFLCFLIVSFSPVKAQQNHFIYLQTENRQPFYVKLDKKVYSSSTSGYLVLAKLKDGSYPLAIGFPKNEWPEQNLVCKVDNKDNGYLLKNFGDKGWGLFNLQSLEVVMANTKAAAPVVAKETKTDAFSDMLANVVNDPTIRDADPKEPVKEPVKEVVKEPVKPVTEPEPAKQEPVKTEVAVTDNTSKSTTEVVAPVIIRLLLNTNSTGTEMLYVDISKGKKDTIAVFIPADSKPSKKEAAPKKPKEVVTVPIEEKKDIVAVVDDKSTDTKFLPMEVANPNTTPKEEKKQEEPVPEQKPEPVAETKEPVIAETKEVATGENKEPVSEKKEAVVPEKKEQVIAEKKEGVVTTVDKTAETPARSISPMINSDCKGFATEDDFLKLRKKMAASENDDAMMAATKKLLKSKCFTTEQVKNLSVLFLTDAGKYAFFDMTYPFVSDSHFFSGLSSQLTDPYYIDRFKVMIRK